MKQQQKMVLSYYLTKHTKFQKIGQTFTEITFGKNYYHRWGGEVKYSAQPLQKITHLQSILPLSLVECIVVVEPLHPTVAMSLVSVPHSIVHIPTRISSHSSSILHVEEPLALVKTLLGRIVIQNTLQYKKDQ